MVSAIRESALSARSFMKGKEFDINNKSIRIELGPFLSSFITDEENKTKFFNLIEDFRTEVIKEEKIEIPEVHIIDNKDLNLKEYRIIINGKVMIDTYISIINFLDHGISIMNNLDQQIFHGIIGKLKQSLFYFKKVLWVNNKKFEEMLHEQSREAYKFLHFYYTRIEPDKVQAFHWLKRLSYYECIRDIQRLITCYEHGIGCEKNLIQAEKLRLKYLVSNKEWRNKF